MVPVPPVAEALSVVELPEQRVEETGLTDIVSAGG